MTKPSSSKILEQVFKVPENLQEMCATSIMRNPGSWTQTGAGGLAGPVELGGLGNGAKTQMDGSMEGWTGQHGYCISVKSMDINQCPWAGQRNKMWNGRECDSAGRIDRTNRKDRTETLVTGPTEHDRSSSELKLGFAPWVSCARLSRKPSQSPCKSIEASQTRFLSA